MSICKLLQQITFLPGPPDADFVLAVILVPQWAFSTPVGEIAHVPRPTSVETSIPLDFRLLVIEIQGQRWGIRRAMCR